MNIITIALILILIACVILVYFFYTRTSNNNYTEHSDVIIPKKESFTNKRKTNVNNNLIMTINYKNKLYNLELELFDDSVPRTTKNFRQIAIKGINGKTYNGNNFHRVIKNFMLQGGDIINQDGTGSVSIYGNQFEDENFSYKHDKPGLLSMANSGPDTNGSQFFITTVPTPHLDGKHVVFGRVVKGINHLKFLENVPTSNGDKPINPMTIISIKNK